MKELVMQSFDWLEIEFGLINSRFTQVQAQGISLERGSILVRLIRKDFTTQSSSVWFLKHK